MTTVVEPTPTSRVAQGYHPINSPYSKATFWGHNSTSAHLFFSIDGRILRIFGKRLSSNVAEAALMIPVFQGFY
jgi:hypothetical protein